MLVLKSLDINLLRSEKKTLIGFFSLYMILCVIILSIISYMYINFQKELMLEEKRATLQNYSNEFIFRLKDLHVNFDKYKYYPRDEKFKSAIFDNRQNLIFSTLEDKNINLNKGLYLTNKGKIHLVKEPESYYLGAKYIIIEIDDSEVWIKKTKDVIFPVIILLFVVLLLIGYFLLNLFLKPMRDALYLLDRFIKDTTHELNTPISAIVTNIEMIDKNQLDSKLLKKINRIDIGAKTISNIYEDLTYLTLNNKIISQNINLNLSELINNRVEYFKSLSNVKKIKIIKNIKKDIYFIIDEKKISKLIDNLLSNAIKYNKINGEIKVTLEKNFFIIEDSGKGMSKKQLDELFIRYKRFDKSVGGFGIGLSIVALIAKEYNLKIDVTSKIEEGTKFEVSWEN